MCTGRTNRRRMKKKGGGVLGDGGEEVSIFPVLYPRGTVSVSSLGTFSSVGSSSKRSHPSFFSLSEHATLKSISRRRGVGNENLLSHSRRRPVMRIGLSKVR